MELMYLHKLRSASGATEFERLSLDQLTFDLDFFGMPLSWAVESVLVLYSS